MTTLEDACAEYYRLFVGGVSGQRLTDVEKLVLHRALVVGESAVAHREALATQPTVAGEVEGGTARDSHSDPSAEPDVAMRCVPREPTPKMLEAAIDAWIPETDPRQWFRDAYRAMVRVAPPAQAEQEVRILYEQLLYAVAQKHPGETRHETALRYIMERENQTSDVGQADAALHPKEGA